VRVVDLPSYPLNDPRLSKNPFLVDQPSMSHTAVPICTIVNSGSNNSDYVEYRVPIKPPHLDNREASAARRKCRRGNAGRIGRTGSNETKEEKGKKKNKTKNKNGTNNIGTSRDYATQTRSEALSNMDYLQLTLKAVFIIYRPQGYRYT
jgi:hypothetical protein